jgi:hypothetical protein
MVEMLSVGFVLSGNFGDDADVGDKARSEVATLAYILCQLTYIN